MLNLLKHIFLWSIFLNSILYTYGIHTIKASGVDASTKNQADPVKSISDAASHQNLQNVAQSKQWLRLLHYRRTFPFFQKKSQADGESFFLSGPDGTADSYKELLATIHAFQDSNSLIGPLKQKPQCAFPARWEFLKHNLAAHGLAPIDELKDIQDSPCPQVQEYLDRFQGNSATLVYSAAYPNNPASMFGHTFLRINKRTGEGTQSQSKKDILDNGVSYAAAVGDENGIVFALFGLFGGYQGHFSFLPYYAKVNEYVHSESRDLWEYDLAINSQQTVFMLKHLWELETNTFFQYYFFDENCAYIIMRLLEVARPDWDLPSYPLYAIPGETVKDLYLRPGIVTGIHFRPSLRKKMLQAIDALDDAEREVLTDLRNLRTSPSEIQNTFLLDTYILTQSYFKNEKGFKKAPEQQKAYDLALVQRSKLADAPIRQLDELDTKTMPHESHNPLRLGTTFSLFSDRRTDQLTQDLEFKFMIHDLFNDDHGYIPFSQVQFPGIKLKYFYEDKRLQIQSIDGIAVTSLFPLTSIEKRPSWVFSFGYRPTPDIVANHSDEARAWYGEAGIGVSLATPKHSVLAYSLLMADAEISSYLRKGFRIGPKLRFGVLTNPVSLYKTGIEANIHTDPFQKDRSFWHHSFKWTHSFLFSRWFDLRASYTYHLGGTTYGKSPRYIADELALSFNFYL